MLTTFLIIAFVMFLITALAAGMAPLGIVKTGAWVACALAVACLAAVVALRVLP